MHVFKPYYTTWMRSQLFDLTIDLMWFNLNLDQNIKKADFVLFVKDKNTYLRIWSQRHILYTNSK